MTPTSLPNAYATIALAPSGGKDRKGRVFAIYNFNEKNVTCERPKATKACKTSRNDELGSFVMKYSDDVRFSLAPHPTSLASLTLLVSGGQNVECKQTACALPPHRHRQ
jgi:hypothetical protein